MGMSQESSILLLRICEPVVFDNLRKMRRGGHLGQTVASAAATGAPSAPSLEALLKTHFKVYTALRCKVFSLKELPLLFALLNTLLSIDINSFHSSWTNLKTSFQLIRFGIHFLFP